VSADDDQHDLQPGGRGLTQVVREFLRTEAAGGIALLAAAVFALVWANSPWQGGYQSLWSSELTVGWGRFALTEDLQHWVNDGLMALFFFVVGLEIKRELVRGELRDPRTAAVPAIAAIGGMLVPAAIYSAVNAGQVGLAGWGIPMATDIAFAVGVVALLGRRIPASLKLFLLTLAIVDDIGAIVVIAVFYNNGIHLTALLVDAAVLAAMVVLWRVGVTWFPLFVLAGIVVWVAMFESGVHATIAGVILGLLTPIALIPRLEHVLHPWSSFVIVPLFALANAGVTISSGAFSAPGAAAVAVGIGAGLLVGKTVGITGATWMAVRSGLGRLPEGSSWRQLTGIATVAGIGFTVSLFISALAFSDASLVDAAKLAILLTSTAAALLGTAILLRARQATPTADDAVDS